MALEMLFEQLKTKTEIAPEWLSTGLFESFKDEVEFNTYEDGNVAVLNVFNKNYAGIYRNISISWYKSYKDEKRVDFSYGTDDSLLHFAYYPERNTMDYWIHDKKIKTETVKELDLSLNEVNEISFMGNSLSGFQRDTDRLTFNFIPYKNYNTILRLPFSIFPE